MNYVLFTVEVVLQRVLGNIHQYGLWANFTYLFNQLYLNEINRNVRPERSSITSLGRTLFRRETCRVVAFCFHLDGVRFVPLST